MSANVEQCEICNKLIDNLDSPWVANEQVVCAFCWATSRIVEQAKTVKRTGIVKSTAPMPVTSVLLSAVTISAVAGMGYVAMFFARASRWWFHS